MQFLGSCNFVCLQFEIPRLCGLSEKLMQFLTSSIENLPNDKPVLYRIKTENGNDNYVGVAQRGRVRERIAEHLGKIPGSYVTIEQFSSINDARAKEANVIKRSQPKYNKQGK